MMQQAQKTTIRQLKYRLRLLQDAYARNDGAQVAAQLYWFGDRGFTPVKDPDTLDEYQIPYDQLIPLLNAREIDIRVKEMNEWLEEARKTRVPARRRQLRQMIRVAASWFYANAPVAQLDSDLKYKVFYTALRPGFYFRIMDKSEEEE